MSKVFYSGDVWVFPKIGGKPPKWMIYNGKPYWNGWFGGTIIFGNTHVQNSGDTYKFPWVGAFQRECAKAHEIDGRLLLHRASHYLCFFKHQDRGTWRKKTQRTHEQKKKKSTSSWTKLLDLMGKIFSHFRCVLWSHLEIMQLFFQVDWQNDDQSSGPNHNWRGATKGWGTQHANVLVERRPGSVPDRHSTQSERHPAF